MQIDKAKDSLQAAELCYERKLYNSTANRAYYAMFQAAIVALETTGVKPAGERWSHEGLHATFSLELTRKRKAYPHSLAVMLADGLTVRNEADYEDAGTSERRAYQILRWAREFVERVEEVVSHERRPE